MKISVIYKDTIEYWRLVFNRNDRPACFIYIATSIVIALLILEGL